MAKVRTSNQDRTISLKAAVSSFINKQTVVNVTHDYTNCCLYIVDPPDDEQQASQKHIKAYYLDKLIQGVQLKSGPILMSNLFTKIYNMLHYTTNLYLQ